MQAVQYMNETRRPIAPGMVLSGSEIPDLNVGPLEHWLACVPDRGIPEKFAHPEGSVRFVLLMGISDAEMQHALRVNPSLADGREVLFEALRQGGVYPVTDTERLCMTRRGDFHRLWENAFRTVRERKAE
jgi:hypothetical protein